VKPGEKMPRVSSAKAKVAVVGGGFWKRLV
jgi:hypothetical protein